MFAGAAQERPPLSGRPEWLGGDWRYIRSMCDIAPVPAYPSGPGAPLVRRSIRGPVTRPVVHCGHAQDAVGVNVVSCIQSHCTNPGLPVATGLRSHVVKTQVTGQEFAGRRWRIILAAFSSDSTTLSLLTLSITFLQLYFLLACLSHSFCM